MSAKIANLTEKIDKSASYALNLMKEFPLANLYIPDERLVARSDADEQILLHFALNEALTLNAIKIVSPSPTKEGPKTVKLYVNRTSMSFDDCQDSAAAAQVLEFTPADLSAESPPKQLKQVKFNKIVSLTIFIEDNQGGEDHTSLSGVQIFGSSNGPVKMGELKKVGHEE